MTIEILEDMHVHSRFSDGEGTVEENARQAAAMGLRRLGCVDHVRRDTEWLPAFLAEVDRVGRLFPQLSLFAGVEAKILNQDGYLDMPEQASAANLVYAADHRFPLADRCLAPAEVRDLLKSGQLTPGAATAALVDATRNAMMRTPGCVAAHLFSILPKVGLSEDHVTDAHLRELAATARRTGCRIEISERWRCPSTRAAGFFLRAGVPIFYSTDSHRTASIGVYRFAAEVAGGVGDNPGARDRVAGR